MDDPNSRRYTVVHLQPFHTRSWTGTDSKGKNKNKNPTIRAARELRGCKFVPTQYIVPGYIAEGCTLFAGRPKLCKSWLMIEMGLSVSMGALCLGGIQCD